MGLEPTASRSSHALLTEATRRQRQADVERRVPARSLPEAAPCTCLMCPATFCELVEGRDQRNMERGVLCMKSNEEQTQALRAETVDQKFLRRQRLTHGAETMRGCSGAGPSLSPPRRRRRTAGLSDARLQTCVVTTGVA